MWVSLTCSPEHRRWQCRNLTFPRASVKWDQYSSYCLLRFPLDYIDYINILAFYAKILTFYAQNINFLCPNTNFLCPHTNCLCPDTHLLCPSTHFLHTPQKVTRCWHLKILKPYFFTPYTTKMTFNFRVLTWKLDHSNAFKVLFFGVGVSIPCFFDTFCTLNI